LEVTVKTSTRILAPLFAFVVLTGGGAWLASPHAGASRHAAAESADYEHDYLPSQLVNPAAYGEQIETF